MSGIRWCDAGGHPFSENDKGATQYTNTKVSNDRREVLDICGECNKSNRLNLQSFGAPAKAEEVESADPKAK